MRVTYTVSWEEFWEVHKSSAPKANFASFVGMIFIGLATCVFGVILTSLVGPEDRSVSATFIWLSLAVFLAAFWDLKLRPKRHKQQFVANLHDSYSRSYSGEQTFSFDPEKWTHQAQDGKYECAWEKLRYVVEYTNVFGLWTRTYLVMIPKRALGADLSPADTDPDRVPSLGDLRRYAFGPADNAIRCQLGFSDYVLTEVPSLWRRRTFSMIAAHLVGLLFFVLLVDGLRQSPADSSFRSWAVAFLIFFLTITAQFGYFAMQYIVVSALRISWESEFTDRGECVRSPRTNYFGAWETFRKFRETRRCFLLYLDSTRYHLYPKRCFSSDQQAVLRKLLEAKLPNERELP